MSHNHRHSSSPRNLGPAPPSANPAEEGVLVVVHETATETETALLSLESHGIDLSRVSVIGPGAASEPEYPGEPMEVSRRRRAASTWIRIQSLLIGSQFFDLPGIGPVVTAGPMVSWLNSCLEIPPIAGNLSALCTALFTVGVPGHFGREYESELKRGRFLTILQGSKAKVAAAGKALERTTLGRLRSHSLKHH